MKRAKFNISTAMLAKALGMPKDTRIFHVESAPFDNEMVFHITHDGLPEVRDGEITPEINGIASATHGDIEWDWQRPNPWNGRIIEIVYEDD